MTLPSKHMIRNSNPGGLRPSSLRLCHGASSQYWIFTSERGNNISFLWNLKAIVGFKPADSFNYCTRAGLEISFFSKKTVRLVTKQIKMPAEKITCPKCEQKKYLSGFFIAIWEKFQKRWTSAYNTKCERPRSLSLLSWLNSTNTMPKNTIYHIKLPGRFRFVWVLCTKRWLDSL